MTQRFNEFHYFSSPVYCIECPEFLDQVTEVSEEYLGRLCDLTNELYPVRQTENYSNDEKVRPFVNFILEQSHHVLSRQGYAMDVIEPVFDVMWTQEHHKFSLMETHIHSWTTIVGFYFLEVPENSSRVVFHDPRPSKVMTNLMQADPSIATVSSDMINFEPKPGLMILSNAWLPHSFTRHGSEEIMKFVHFNVTVQTRRITELPELPKVIIV